MIEWANIVLQGVLVGGLYALFATGLSLSFGIMRTINIAHGDLAVMAGFGAIVMQGRFGLPLIVVLPVVVGVAALAGYGLQRAVLNRVLGNDILPPLLVTFGVSIVAQNVLLAMFSADSRSLPVGDLSIASVALGSDLAVGVLPLIVMAVAVGVLAALQWLFSTTRIGRAFRAASTTPRSPDSWASTATVSMRSRWRWRSPRQQWPACSWPCAQTSRRQTGRAGCSMPSRR